MESKARQIHGQAEHAREGGDFLDSLKFTDEATVLYQQENDGLGFAEVQASRFLTYKHLHEQTGYKGYLVLAKFAAQASVETAEMSGIDSAKSLPYFNLAKAHQLLDELPAAIENFKKSIELMDKFPSEKHQSFKGLIIADMSSHLAFAEYKNGDKTALDRMLQAISSLDSEDGPTYQKDVWRSGAHMRTAEMLKQDDLEKAEEHLQKAKEIIDTNPDLKLRLGQWEKLAKSF